MRPAITASNRREAFPPRSFRFAVGQDRQGRWVLRDRLGLIEGSFRDRCRAIDHAMQHGGGLPMQVFCLADDQLQYISEVFPDQPYLPGDQLAEAVFGPATSGVAEDRPV